MVDPGESAPAALVRELAEETGVDLADVDPVVLARTYVDDPRNTDLAWICSTVAVFEVPDRIAATAASDALDAAWFPFGSVDELLDAIARTGGELYAAHRPLLAAAAVHFAGAGQRVEILDELPRSAGVDLEAVAAEIGRLGRKV